ncbi:MAG: AraC family transcriptional regulator [Bacteroidota bacterium]|nr:AraC family transcriptional regulator [Bacteroidota bacterium]
MSLAQKILREITPLTQSDCFTIFSRSKKEFDFPLHFHEEYELNFIRNAEGAQRVVGDHVEEIGNIELVLVGPNLQHGWFTNKCKGKTIDEITIQFHRNLFDEKFLQRNQMSFIRTLLQRSARGVLFSKATTLSIMPRLIQLPQRHGFDSVLELMSILHDLSTSRNLKTLSDVSFNTEMPSYNSRRIERIMQLLNKDFGENITLGDAAKIAGMAEVSFSRFFKFRTGKTFIDTLNEVRLGHATRMLIDTTNSINEIAYKCGFNNMSNFNRIFKRKKQSTPKEFRQNYTATGVRRFV